VDVIEAGSDRTRSGRGPSTAARAGVVIAVIALAVVIAIAAVQWWGQRSERPDRLEIVAFDAIGPFAISGSDLPADWPQGLVAGALRLRAEVNGAPQQGSRVTSSGEGDAYVASGVEDIVVPAGESTGIDMIVTPADCGRLDSAGSPLVDASGAPVPVSSTASDQLREALASLCAPGGEAPALTAAEARIDVFFRDRTLVMTVATQVAANRIVLQPLDSAGFRARGQQEASVERDAAVVRLRWLISPAEAAGLADPAVRVRAFSIVDGRAYPWLLTLAIPPDLTLSTAPPARPRNDGIDLAEVAPRPAG
jgi:hypothetical protein